MTRCESYPLCSGTIYFPTAPSLNFKFSQFPIDFIAVIFFYYLFAVICCS